MDTQLHTFMVEMVLPEFSEEFMALIPKQRALVERYMSAGTITSFALALDRSRCWFSIVAPSEENAAELIAEFPVAPFVDVRLTELAFHEHPFLNVTHFSLN